MITADSLFRYHLTPLIRTLREQTASYKARQVSSNLDSHSTLAVFGWADNHDTNEFPECVLRLLTTLHCIGWSQKSIHGS
jgi:hypothetical protein